MITSEPPDASSDADSIIRRLGLTPHPEGGYFRETWRDTVPDAPTVGARGSGTAIYFLLKAGEVSRWHRVDAVEIWHFYAGDPLELRITDGIGRPTMHSLGRDIERGERPQIIVPKNAWQSARIAAPKIGWTLVGCTVSPAFDFAGFELAPDGWEP
jgi:predicted cupin superfamily sugar epimerase